MFDSACSICCNVVSYDIFQSTAPNVKALCTVCICIGSVIFFCPVHGRLHIEDDHHMAYPLVWTPGKDVQLASLATPGLQHNAEAAGVGSLPKDLSLLEYESPFV